MVCPGPSEAIHDYPKDTNMTTDTVAEVFGAEHAATRVYQFGLLPPVEGAELVRAQIRAAHEYRNDHVAIERGRRHALRAILDTPEIHELEDVVRGATKATRRAAKDALRKARRLVLNAAPEETARINDLCASIRRDARALTTCYWGSYLTIEAAADQVRQMPLYADDALEPSDPKFQRWTGSGQIGVQLQGGAAIPAVLARSDTRLGIEMLPHARGRDGWPQYATLSMRVGSDGRAPIWARWPCKIHRAIPDAAVVKWARVSCRVDGPHQPRWTCELTLQIPDKHPHTLDVDLAGAIAVNMEWYADSDRIRVASWLDDQGRRGQLKLDEHMVKRLKKSAGIRSVRDQLLNDLRPRLAQTLAEAHVTESWLLRELATMLLWKSPSRFHALARRWRAERCDAARAAYDLLQAWELRDAHLWEYEAGARGRSLRARREIYRLQAVKWAGEYRTVVLLKHDLSREARFGPDADLRQIAGPSTLREAVRQAFGGEELILARPPANEEDPVDDCAHMIERWREGENTTLARSGLPAENKEKGGAWARRKKKKVEKEVTARKAAANGAE